MDRRSFGMLLCLTLAAALPMGKVAQAQSNAQDGAAPAPSAESSWTRQLGLDTSIRGAYWSSDRDLNDQKDFSAGSFWLRAQPKFNDRWSAKAEGWLQAQSSDGGGHGKQELREAYTTYQGDVYDVRVGRQIVVWGRADQINPTDNLGSKDLTLLFPEIDDLRRGNGMVRVSRAFGDYVVSGLWLPEFRPNVYPLGTLPTGVHFDSDDNPEQYDQSAFKLDHTGGALDWSVSYFDGLDRNFDIGIQKLGLGGMTLQRQYYRIRTLGADFAFNLGRFGLRGEAAYTDTADSKGTNPLIKNPFFYAVLGADRTFFEYLSVNVQYIYRATSEFHDPHSIANPRVRAVAIQDATASGQLTSTQNGMSTRIGYKWFNETLEAEIAAVGYFERGDSLLRAKVLYRFTDTLRMSIGQETFDGPTESLFGLQKKNSATYAEAVYGF